MPENRADCQPWFQPHLVLCTRQILYFASLCFVFCYILWGLGVDAIFYAPLFVAAALVVGPLLWGFFRPKMLKRAAISLVAGIVVATLGGAVLSRLYDTTYDGMRAHQAAIIALKNGWNPVLDPQFVLGEEILQKYEEINAVGHQRNETGRLSSILRQGKELQGNIFVGTGYKNNSFYCLAALVFRATGNLESAKVVHLLMMLVAFGLTFRYLSSLNCRSPLWLAGLISLNPVCLYQMASFMLDGFTYSLFQLFFVSVLSLFEDRYSKILWLDLICAGLLLITSKISGFSYFAAILAAVVIFLTLVYFIRVPLLAKVRWVLLLFSLVVAFSSFFSVYRLANVVIHDVSFSSITHWMSKRDQSRPGLAGIPQLKEQTKIERFFWSEFSETHINPGAYRLKIPGVVLSNELEQLKEGHGEYRTGGFGSLYSLMIVFASLLILLRPGLMKQRTFITFGLIVAVISCFSPVWWARWAAYQWLIPFVPLMLIVGDRNAIPGNMAFCLRGGVLNGDLVKLVASLNCMIVGFFYFSGKLEVSSEIREVLREFSTNEEAAELFYSTFPSNQQWFLAEGIEVRGCYMDDKYLDNLKNVNDLPATNSRFRTIRQRAFEGP